MFYVRVIWHHHQSNQLAATADLANLLIIYHLLQSMYTIEMVIISPHSIITNPILLKMKHYGQIVTSVT